MFFFGQFEVVRYDANGSLDSVRHRRLHHDGGWSPLRTRCGRNGPDGRIVVAGLGNIDFDYTTLELFGDFAVVRYGAPAPVNNPLVVTITGPASGSVYPVHTPIDFTGRFTDDAGEPHTAAWTFDSVTIPAPVVEPSGSTTGWTGITGAITQARVYKVKLTVTDNGGLSGTSTTVGGFEDMVVIYDPACS